MSFSFANLVRIETKATEGLQIETSFTYKLNSKDGLSKDFPKEYHVETFFFLPPQLNVNSSTYPIQDFYRDMKSFINFRIPKLSYKELIGIGKNYSNSPIHRIQKYLNQMSQKPSTLIDHKYLLQELRVWACAFFYYTDRRLQKLRTIESSSKDKFDDDHKKSAFLKRINEEALKNCSNILKIWSSTIGLLYEKVNTDFHPSIRQVEEYVYMIFRDYICEIHVISQRIINDPTFMEYPFRIQLRLLRWFSSTRKFMWLNSESPAIDIEEYIYHKAILKKTIWSTLYIETRTQPLFQIRKQMGAMIAAGFAGFWAVSADIFINRNPGTTRTLNTSGFILMTALVLAYILKDRIKELGRTRFKSGLFGRLPDTQSKMVFDSGIYGKTVTVGTYSEKAFYEKTKSLPPDLLKIVQGKPFVQQQHIYYSKRIRVYRKRVQRFKLKIRALYDFFRISLSPLMFYVENNQESICIPDKKLNILVDTLPKIYKINLIFKISGKMKIPHESLYKHYQITVSKNRIHRVRSIPLD